MGKYQLDDKGKAQVERYHKKNSKGKSLDKKKLQDLRQEFLNKLSKKD